MSENNKCEKCGINPQSDKPGKWRWNICSSCIKTEQEQGVFVCSGCLRVMWLKDKKNEWKNSLSKKWYDNTDKHKSKYPTCSKECEVHLLKKHPNWAKDYIGDKNKEETERQEQDDQHEIKKCSKCQGEFTKKGDKLIYWMERGKEEVHFCCSCKEKMEKGGLKHADLVSADCRNTTNTDSGENSGIICNWCLKTVKKGHKGDENGKIILKHDCHPKCGNVMIISNCCFKEFHLTQDYVDLLFKYGRKEFYRCPNCQINELKIFDYNDEDKKLLKELERLNGKNNDDNSREREREIQQLRSRIAELETITRTPNQEQELQDKKKELSELERQQEQNQKPSSWKPWIIGGSIFIGILVIGIIAYFLLKDQKRK